MTTDEAATFRRLHARDAGAILVLPNAWDAMSARVVEEAGARAIATTSAGVAWALGRPDGQGLDREQMVEAVRRIASCVSIPVTADVESGYGRGKPEDVAETVRGVIAAGAVGVNLEDSPGRGRRRLLESDEHAERIAAARAAAERDRVDLFVNARIDVYLRSVGEETSRFDETVRRAAAYVSAGADGVFVPGVLDAPTIGRLAQAIQAPLNVMAASSSPPIAELRALGVARVSVGPGITLAAMATIRAAAVELLERGTYESLRDAVPFAEANGLFPRPADSGSVTRA